MRRIIRINLIIHLFALAHALAALSLRLMGWSDEILLTILTVIMIFMITDVYRLTIDISAGIALVCCFAGFFFGTYCIDLFVQNIGNIAGINIYATIIITEILGWITYFFAHKAKSKNKYANVDSFKIK